MIQIFLSKTLPKRSAPGGQTLKRLMLARVRIVGGAAIAIAGPVRGSTGRGALERPVVAERGRFRHDARHWGAAQGARARAHGRRIQRICALSGRRRALVACNQTTLHQMERALEHKLIVT